MVLQLIGAGWGSLSECQMGVFALTFSARNSCILAQRACTLPNSGAVSRRPHAAISGTPCDIKTNTPINGVEQIYLANIAESAIL